MERIALTVKEAAQTLGVSPRAVYRMAHRADFPKVMKGTQILIPVRAFNTWFENQIGTDVIARGTPANVPNLGTAERVKARR